MSIKNKCPFHPKYKAIHKPRNTHKHPEGCKDCWEIYNFKNNMEEVKKNVLTNVLLNKGLVPGKIYNLLTNAFGYRVNSNKKVYDFIDAFELDTNTKLTFLGKENILMYTDPPNAEVRGTKEKEMLTFISDKQTLLLPASMDIFCKLIS